mmetsp:Transcript_30101/g.55126  ORF Transcript_30101/g.55126 Transcript_30101/m.55126 type:complete len:200 (-) Transcript_30101:231-830(-)
MAQCQLASLILFRALTIDSLTASFRYYCPSVMFAAFATLLVLANAQDSCLQPNLRFEADKLKEYESVCCQVPQSWAEPAGSQDEIGFWEKLSPDEETTFYDSQCGKPLFVAPRGRSFAEWKRESQWHGWPSFRKEELVTENIIVREGGETVSSCGTHLGHNLPDEQGARYCIDLLCIAGKPKSTLLLGNRAQKPTPMTE